MKGNNVLDLCDKQKEKREAKQKAKQNVKQKTITLLIMLSAMVFVSACSSYSSAGRPGYSSRAPMATLPEVKRPGASRPVRQTRQPQTVHRPPATHVNKKPSAATVQRYSEKPKNTVITQTEVHTVLKDQKETQAEAVKSEPDPYETIPENPGSASQPESSPAVKSLMIRARADMAIGKDQSAISKLERALRIEPGNANAWYLLARAHQSSNEHQQAITMAKKAINFAGNDDELIAKSWKLIHKSGETSGDSMAVEEAINYSKVNP